MKMKCRLETKYVNAYSKDQYIVNHTFTSKAARINFLTPVKTFTAFAFTSNSAYGIHVIIKTPAQYSRLEKFDKQEVDIEDIFSQISIFECDSIEYRASKLDVHYYETINFENGETLTIAEQMNKDFAANL